MTLLLAAAFVAAFILVRQRKKQTTTAQYTIGILQIASHPALDAAREGFMEELKSMLGGDVAFVVQNAQGSVAQAHGIAQQFHANKNLCGFFAIATPAAQAMSAVEKKKPIFIAAVTDPHALGLVYETGNVCGVKDMINVGAEIEMMVQLVPTSKTVGLLYTSGETNSVIMAKEMRKQLEARGLTAVDFAISNESDMQAIAELACRKSDVILAPTDNTVASAISLLTSLTVKNKKPFIVSDNMLVKFGSLAARGVDYRTCGKQAAQIAYEVLVEGKKPYELPIKQADTKEIFVNETTLKALELTVPEILKDDVVLV